MHLPYFLDNGIDLRLEVGTERFVEPLDIARLGMADATDEIVLHVEDAHHQRIHLGGIDTRNKLRKHYTLGEKFANNIIHLLFQNSSFHCYYFFKKGGLYKATP